MVKDPDRPAVLERIIVKRHGQVLLDVPCGRFSLIVGVARSPDLGVFRGLRVGEPTPNIVMDQCELAVVAGVRQ